jgi:hypothetical protein
MFEETRVMELNYYSHFCAIWRSSIQLNIRI